MLYPGNWNIKDKDKIIDYKGNVKNLKMHIKLTTQIKRKRNVIWNTWFDAEAWYPFKGVLKAELGTWAGIEELSCCFWSGKGNATQSESYIQHIV